MLEWMAQYRGPILATVLFLLTFFMTVTIFGQWAYKNRKAKVRHRNARVPEPVSPSEPAYTKLVEVIVRQEQGARHPEVKMYFYTAEKLDPIATIIEALHRVLREDYDTLEAFLVAVSELF